MKYGYVHVIGMALSFSMIVSGRVVMAAKKDALKEYKKRRDFSKTTEPEPFREKGEALRSSKLREDSLRRKSEVRAASKKKSKSKLLFVVQKHAASHLHYDFRLEIDGVLASWAIPKGPSLDPTDKRLAVMTENHPLAYAHFEGVIPQGEYGGGTVMVWDIGTYENIKQVNGKTISMDECLKNGRIEIVLHGTKLRGAYALVRFKGEKKQWLLIKMKDRYARTGKNITESKSKSALTKRTMDQIARAGVVYDGDCTATSCAHEKRMKGKSNEKTKSKSKQKTKSKSAKPKNR